MPTVNVSQEAYDALTTAVVGKHGKLRGVLKDEASAALLHHAQTLGSKKR